CLYFYNPAKTKNKWILSRPIVKVIGNHRFTK
ncbi:MAG: spore cortex-lytic enzyme, partial [Clostridium sp.]